MSEIKIVPMKEEHLPAVCSIEKDCFSMPWSEKSFLDSSQREDTVFLVAEEERKVVGYLGCYFSYGTGEITNVAVEDQHRGRGIGKQLLEKLFQEGNLFRAEEYFLEVRESNVSARALYEKLGFQKEGIRKNFYERPAEHAVIMKKIMERNTMS